MPHALYPPSALRSTAPAPRPPPPPRARRTPQAFSHFSHEHTGGKLMVVDIQGVDDYYTDPQVHSRSGTGFGAGNMGQEGIDQFYSTHWCNPICEGLGLDFCCPEAAHDAGPAVYQRHGTAFSGSQAADEKRFRLMDYLGDVQPREGPAPPRPRPLGTNA